ncbi:MAG: hypothetical protein Q9175_007379 [Cornicularia normoerica]
MRHRISGPSGSTHAYTDVLATADKTKIRLLVKTILEPNLGPAADDNEDDARHIEFRPWGAVGRQHHRLEGACITDDVLGSEENGGRDRVEEVGEREKAGDEEVERD